MKTSKIARVARLHVWTPQGYAGMLAKDGQHVFNYAPEALDRQDKSREISLTMALRAQSYNTTPMLPVFQTFLPEGFLAERIAKRFGKTLQIDDMALLAFSGGNAIGRIQLSTASEQDAQAPTAESLKEILADQGSRDLFEDLCDRYLIASGISGVQPKVMVKADDDGQDSGDGHGGNDSQTLAGLPSPPAKASIGARSTLRARNLIVKVGGADYPGLAENEFHCLCIAKRANLPVPAFWLSEDGKRFAIERFDIEQKTGVLSGFEDMVSLQGKTNQRKYQASYESIALVIEKNCSTDYVASSLHDLFASLVLSVTLRNGDAHLKNFGLLYSDPTSDDCRLAPIYDVVCTTTYIEKDILALSLVKERAWPSRAALIRFGREVCRVAKPDDVIDSIIEAAASYRPEIRVSQIWTSMKKKIDAAVLCCAR